MFRDLASGAGHEVRLEVPSGSQAGHFVWASDGSALLITLAVGPCSAPSTRATSVIRIETATRKPTTLVHEDDRMFITTGWPVTATTTLQDGAGRAWQMDSATGQLTAQ